MGIIGKTEHVSPEEQQRHVNEGPLDRHGDEDRDLKDKLRHPFPGLRQKLKGTHLHDMKIGAIHLKHKIGKYENLFNQNHRHDEEHEQATDAKRTKIAEGHRFQSFAPERDGNRIKWYIDGRDYFHAVSVALERAKETIYIADWWLSPELFLRRPPAANQHWRLDTVLKRAAERGVKIYVNVYKEVEAAISCNSKHTKHALEALCPEGSPGYNNIVVMRHPDHNVFENAGDMTFYWAHHEKYIVIDYNLAFIGGLDLCFGRWDNRQHPLADAHPAGVDQEIWPGQDWNNNRIMDFQSVSDWKSNEVSKAEYGRMPWHDVAMGVIGPCVYDIAEHFVLRWNFVKRDKYKRDDRYDWITLTGRTGEDEDLIGVQRPKHPVGDYIHHPLSPLEHKTGNPRQGRLVANDSREASGDDEAWHDAQEDVDEHGYTSHQHRYGHGAGKRFDEFRKDREGFMEQHDPGDKFDQFKKEQEDYWEKHDPRDKFHRPSFMQNKSESGMPANASSPKQAEDMDNKQENSMMTGNNPKAEGTVTASGGVTEKSKAYTSELSGTAKAVDGQGSVHAQVVRSSADWSSGILTEQSIQNAYCEIIRGAKHYVYIENQFFITATGDKQAPVHNLIGKAIADAVVAAAKEGRKFRVIIMIPCIPGFAGDLRDDAATGTRAIMDYQYKSINRGEESIYGKIKAAGVDPTQYVFCFNLRSYDRINKTPALKEAEEKSGASYQDLQRAQAETVMPEGVHGAKGEGDPAHPDVENRPAISNEREQKRERLENALKDTGLGTDGRQSDVVSEWSIAKDAMLGEKKVSEEPWRGRGGEKDGGNDPEKAAQEVANFVQEELYIHGKVLIVDDRVVICGSSNINDRSQLGFHDSELSIVMEDTVPLQSKMNGETYTAGHHAATLRRMLWREHLGLLPAQDLDATNDPNAQPPGDIENDWFQNDEYNDFVADPLSDELWKTWTDQATLNTQIFRHLFHADPDDNVKTFEEYDRFLGAKGSRKAGHLYDPYQPVDHVRQELDKIRGHLVWMPLEFLRDAEMAEKGMQVNSWTESVYT
ncbi:phospholipase D/nuclease [Teratosphaeria nubilosa]|uniref:Phospholipase n=1 Tax=Teratosphaeria nubilosa TaxID=161662 RepID=A0A6G1LID5_9PEZI|nr:phospholipase D/nuclease [Teratosphaeria nubilosa]